jgi:putative transposase
LKKHKSTNSTEDGVGMDTRKAAAEYRLAQWSQMIQTCQSSGQSIKEFCKTEGISQNAYFYRQRKIRESVCSALVGQESGKALIPAGWTKLTTAAAPREEETLIIDIDGCQITANAKTNSELLAKVCRILKTI